MELTGHKLTKASIGFYNFSKVQGPILGTLALLLGHKGITHAGLILETDEKEIHFVICSGKKNTYGQRISSCKFLDKEAIDRIGASLLYTTEMWIPPGKTLSDAVTEADNYTDSHAWDMIFHYFVGRFLGLTRPRNCTTHLCSFFNIRDCFTPAELFKRYYDYDTTIRTGKSW